MSDALTPSPSMAEAVRAGWLMEDQRGRLRPDGPAPTRLDFDRRSHALPIPSERSPTEQIIETRRVLAALASTLAVSVPPFPPHATSFSDQLEDASKALDAASAASDEPATLKA